MNRRFFGFLLLGLLLLAGGGAGWRFSQGQVTPAADIRDVASVASPKLSPELVEEAGVFPAKQFPEHVSEELIEVSLGLLAKNGADLRQPMPQVHRVLAASRAAAEAMATWGQQHGFSSRPVEVYYEHGGVERYAVELVKTAVPRAAEIHADGRAIFEATLGRPEVFYQTWQGEIVQ